MKLLEESKTERYYLKVGNLFVRNADYSDIALSPEERFAQEFRKGQTAFKEVYLYAVKYAEKHSLGKVTVVKVVRIIKEEVRDVDQLTMDNLNAFVKEYESEDKYRGL